MRKRAAFARAREVLADVGLADRADDPVNTWSHGMQQRLSVARALLTEPPVLLVDEATHDLDPAAAATVRELIAGCAERGTAVLWATQRLDELRGFAGRVTLMADGVAAFEGTVEALAARAVPESGAPPRVRARAGLPRRRPGSRMSAAGLVAEAAKLPAFVRRDWKIALSYRAVFVGEAMSLAMQIVVFFFIAKLVDPGKLPAVRRHRADVSRVRRRRPGGQPDRRRAAAHRLGRAAAGADDRHVRDPARDADERGDTPARVGLLHAADGPGPRRDPARRDRDRLRSGLPGRAASGRRCCC